MTTHVLTWDPRQGPNIDELDRMVYDVSATRRPVRIYNIDDTGSDENAIVITDQEYLTQEEAQQMFFAWEDSRE